MAKKLPGSIESYEEVQKRQDHNRDSWDTISVLAIDVREMYENDMSEKTIEIAEQGISKEITNMLNNLRRKKDGKKTA